MPAAGRYRNRGGRCLTRYAVRPRCTTNAGGASMTARREKLERLKVVSPCRSSWEAMQGDGRRRHCLECNKPVYDLAALSAREIAGLIEASRGKICGRLTYDAAGRLLTREPLEIG